MLTTLEFVWVFTLVMQVMAVVANVRLLKIAQGSQRWFWGWLTLLIVNIVLIARRVILLSLGFDMVDIPNEEKWTQLVGDTIVPVITSVGLLAFSIQMHHLFKTYKEILKGGSTQNGKKHGD
jgi:hypothetical protein